MINRTPHQILHPEKQEKLDKEKIKNMLRDHNIDDNVVLIYNLIKQHETNTNIDECIDIVMREFNNNKINEKSEEI